MKPKKNTTSQPATSQPTQEQITELAHSLWLEEGKPEGRELQHWLEAERQLRAGGTGEPRAAEATRNPAGETREEIEADKRVDGMSPPRRDPRTPKGEGL